METNDGSHRSSISEEGVTPAGAGKEPQKAAEEDAGCAGSGCGLLIIGLFIYAGWWAFTGVTTYWSELQTANSLSVPFKDMATGLGFSVVRSAPDRLVLRLLTQCSGMFGDGFKQVTLLDPPASAAPVLKLPGGRPVPPPPKPPRPTMTVTLEKLFRWGQTHAANLDIKLPPKTDRVILYVIRGVDAYQTRKRSSAARSWRDEVDIRLNERGGVLLATFRSEEKPDMSKDSR